MINQISRLARMPWRGMHPGKLLVRGIVQVGFMGFVGVIALQVRTGAIELDEGMAEYQSGIETAATVALIIAGISIVVGAVQVVVGVLDLTPRRSIEGVVVRAGSRRTGDSLPYGLQMLLFRRRDSHGNRREHQRRYWNEIVLDTDSGRRVFTVRPRLVNQVRAGAFVRLKASPILGYVAKLEGVSTAPEGTPADLGVSPVPGPEWTGPAPV
jgi:hypothetical protein